MVKVKVKSTGFDAIITPRAYDLQEKLFIFIANVQVDEEGNEVAPQPAPKAVTVTPIVSADSEESPNEVATGSASGAAPVVVSSGNKPGRKPKPQ